MTWLQVGLGRGANSGLTLAPPMAERNAIWLQKSHWSSLILLRCRLLNSDDSLWLAFQMLAVILGSNDDLKVGSDALERLAAPDQIDQ